MSTKLIFQTDDDTNLNDLKMVLCSHEAYAAIHEIKEWLRQEVKYHDCIEQNPNCYDTLVKVRERVAEITANLPDFD